MSIDSKAGRPQRCVCNFSEQDLKPSMEAFEALGFTFQFSETNVISSITLPPGWIFSVYGTLRDLSFRPRGEISFTQDTVEPLVTSIILFPKYSIEATEEYDGMEAIVVRDSENHRLYTAGAYSNRKKRDHFVAKAERWLNINYPNWKDVTKYWD